MKTRPGLLLALPFAASLSAAAHAQLLPRRHTYHIAPGTPATVGQSGAVEGVVPHQPVPAPRGSMATFGGLLGTGAPQTAPGGTATPASPGAAATPAAPR